MPKSVTEALRMAEPRIEGEAERRFIRNCIEEGDAFDAELEKIEASPYLNEAGRAMEREKLRQRKDAGMGEYESATTKDLDDKIKGVLDDIAKGTEPEPERDGVAEALVYAEIRANVAALGLDTLGLEEAYIRADAKGQKAMENAPLRLVKTQDGVRWVPWVSQERIDATRLSRASARRPEAVEALRALQGQRAALRHFVGVVRQAMFRAVPRGTSDPVTLRDLDGRDVTPRQQ